MEIATEWEKWQILLMGNVSKTKIWGSSVGTRKEMKGIKICKARQKPRLCKKSPSWRSKFCLFKRDILSFTNPLSRDLPLHYRGPPPWDWCWRLLCGSRHLSCWTQQRLVQTSGKVQGEKKWRGKLRKWQTPPCSTFPVFWKIITALKYPGEEVSNLFSNKNAGKNWSMGKT